MINWILYRDSEPNKSGVYLLATATTAWGGSEAYRGGLYNYDHTVHMFYDINNLDYGYFEAKDDSYWCYVDFPNKGD